MAGRSGALVNVADKVSSFDTNHPDVKFSVCIASATAALLTTLTRTNMQTLYDTSGEWRWSDAKKNSEFSHPKSRFFIWGDQPVGGFLCFRFLVESGLPVMYIWELQVVEKGAGIGSKLLSLASKFCQTQTAIKDQFLTCFSANQPALDFYYKHGFRIHKSSPPNACYRILCRKLVSN